MKKLLFSIKKKDFNIQIFQSSGKSGQHQNRTDSGIRIIHKISGAIGESRLDRSQYRNKKIALKRLIETNKFKLWIQIKTHEIINKKNNRPSGKRTNGK